ncbi:hypothetical protein HOP50_03g22290 [Chloropicon primus]|uniref:Uncharacterized protein n=1 Tax=Chloropicon primus TaxID=1764295 RepID=A0A5B8MK28_9CHLO|nr:hypothetical protein A3770_03p22300 [Chloropicon primus]UPQ98923.1 hypothetical protein HOP50_03g22290 [Chloropicon primus]|eukprot:QDZ19712.1 hypothetical protein A3770_03p22300 [Chloropicon primus]
MKSSSEFNDKARVTCDLLAGVTEAMEAKPKGQTKVVLICLCIAGLEDVVVQRIGKALARLVIKLNLARQGTGARDTSDLATGVYLLGGSSSCGACTTLADPRDCSLQSLLRACQVLEKWDGYSFEKGDVLEGGSSFVDQLTSLTTRDAGVAQAIGSEATSVKIVAMASEAGLASSESSFQSVLGDLSSRFVEIDLVEIKNAWALEGASSRDPASGGSGALQHLVAACESAAYYSIDLFSSDDLEFFIAYQCAVLMLGRQPVEVAFGFPSDAEEEEEALVLHCLLSPTILGLDSCPDRGLGAVYTSQGASPSSSRQDSRTFVKCAVTGQFVPRSNEAFRLGSMRWKLRPGPAGEVGGGRRGGSAEIAFRVLARMSLSSVNHALLFGLPYLASANEMMQESAARSVWNHLIADLKERKECLLVSCAFDFDRTKASAVPLTYLLTPDATCRNMLLKRIASGEELLPVETAVEEVDDRGGEVGDSSPQESLARVSALIDSVPLCSDVTEVPFDLKGLAGALISNFDQLAEPRWDPPSTVSASSTRKKYGRIPSASKKPGHR